eukprot:scaffold442_cov397-Prasinococcus_capsulatus_cf.AAC.9
MERSHWTVPNHRQGSPPPPKKLLRSPRGLAPGHEPPRPVGLWPMGARPRSRPANRRARAVADGSESVWVFAYHAFARSSAANAK